MNKDNLKALYCRYLRGECNRNEEKLLQLLLPDLLEREFFSFEEVLDVVEGMELEAAETEAVFSRILSDSSPIIPMHKKSFTMLRRIAAVLLFVLLSMGAVFYYTFQKDRTYMVYSNPGPFVKTIVLPDSTRVVLASHATLTQISDFKTSDLRKVRLSGEAFFEVRKDPAKAFVVESKTNFEVRVLGTAFNLIDLPGKGQLVLSKGLVRVRKANREAVVVPGQKAEYTAGRGFDIEAVDTLAFSSWKSGLKYFDKQVLSDLVADLERLYGVNLHLDPAYSHKTYSGYLPVDSLDKTILILNKAYKTTIIYKK